MAILTPGDRIGGYEILYPIGTGSTAEVYAARDPAGEPCAFKVMEGEKKRARFLQGGDALAQIVHPNVVRVLGAGAWGSRLWLALELCEGETLGQKVRAGGRVRLDVVLDWIQQIAEGIVEAHRLGIVHRDLSSENVIVMRDGHVKIVDFGVARMAAWGVRTTKDRPIGAGRNMAPEVGRGEQATPSADVYALGHLLYEAIAGVHAMGGPCTVMNAILWHLTQEARPLEEHAPWVPPGLAALAHDAMEKDPAKRPASAGDFLVRLKRERAALRAPQLREVRGVPGISAALALAPTVPIAVYDAEGRMASPAEGRAAAPPSAPTAGAARTMPMAVVLAPAPAVALPLPAEPRSTDVPVESAARRSSVTLRRARAPAAFVLGGGAALAIAGWLFATRVLGPMPGAAIDAASSAFASAPAPTAAPVAARPPAATASASATAPSKPPRAKPPARRAPATPRAKSRLFGTDP